MKRLIIEDISKNSESYSIEDLLYLAELALIDYKGKLGNVVGEEDGNSFKVTHKGNKYVGDYEIKICIKEKKEQH